MLSKMKKARGQYPTTGINMGNLGRILRELREDLELSLRKAAKAADISPAHLCKIERGKTFQSLGIHVLLQLAEVYKIPAASIMKKAGFIEDSDDYLPPLNQYLRMKFQFPLQAIRDIELAKSLVETKYSHLIPSTPPSRNSKGPQKQGKLI